MKRFVLAITLAAAVPAMAADTPPSPPRAEKRPHIVRAPFGAERQDEYYWLRDDTRKDPAMLAYLNAENAYADAILAPTRPLQDRLYAETIGRIKQDDSSVPYRKNGYWYYSRFAAGAQYSVLARRKGSMTAPEEVLLDQPAMAVGKAFFSVGGSEISPDNRLIAWTEDNVGRRQFSLRVKDIATGRILPDSVVDVDRQLVWGADGRTILYVVKDPVTLRPFRVMAHVLGTPATADKVVFTETDDRFNVGVFKTSDDRFICLGSSVSVSDEIRCAPAGDLRRFTVLAARQRDLKYDADHAGGRWVIRTNRAAPDYKLVTVADVAMGAGVGAWRDLEPPVAGRFIENFRPFDHYVAIEERSGGNKRIRLLAADGTSRMVDADEPAFTMGLSVNAEESDWVRYSYGSLVTPSTTYEVNARTGERRVLKETPVPGYDRAKYVTERVWITARDGARIPVSLVHARNVPRDGTAPLYQYGYGSYGVSMDPAFSPELVGLLDRGVVYAVAHIRGGQEMGRAWYDAGHMMHKRNSFTDFIDVTRGLVAQGYAAKGRVAAAGGSAGGLLMGAVANMAPADYRVVVAQVPFVDVVTTMLDASIPLTTGEYDEWGNPAEPAAYAYMLGYSPYDQVTAQAYPAMYVGTGLWDSQVQYYEPAKWVARLRDRGTGDRPLVFRTNMNAGHGGKSGRFERYRQNAEANAFVLTMLGSTGSSN